MSVNPMKRPVSTIPGIIFSCCSSCFASLMFPNVASIMALPLSLIMGPSLPLVSRSNVLPLRA